MYPEANHALFHQQCNYVPALCWSYIPGASKVGAKPTSSNKAARLTAMRRRSGRKCIEMAKWFESARGGTESAREGTESAREGTESAREGTESAREGTESAREGTESAREGIESAREGTESAREGTESALVSLR